MRKIFFENGFNVDERGALTPLMLVLFIGIIISTGVALDLVRHDAERSDLQDALGFISECSQCQWGLS